MVGAIIVAILGIGVLGVLTLTLFRIDAHLFVFLDRSHSQWLAAGLVKRDYLLAQPSTREIYERLRSEVVRTTGKVSVEADVLTAIALYDCLALEKTDVKDS